MTAYTVRELSADPYPDFEKLALKQGGCWCMHYQREKPIRGVQGEEWKKINRRDKKALVNKGKSHAILVYSCKIPVGWCQYGAREELPGIDAGRGYRKLNPEYGDTKLWRITCFFVDRAYRSRGVSKFALKAALESIKKQGGGIVESYPVVSKKWLRYRNGVGSEHQECSRGGFKQVGPLGTTWVLMRKTVLPASHTTLYKLAHQTLRPSN
jgi:GNAT superfamily N-acetyltransferase